MKTRLSASSHSLISTYLNNDLFIHVSLTDSLSLENALPFNAISLSNEVLDNIW